MVLDDAGPSRLGTFFYAVGGGNPLRSESPYVSIVATLQGVITGVD